MASSFGLNEGALAGEPDLGLEHFRLLANTLREGLVVQAATGDVIWHNAQAETILGLSGPQLRGEQVHDPGFCFIHPDGSPIAPSEQPSSVALRTGIPQTDIVMGVQHPNRPLVWTVATANLLPEGTGVVTSYVDITERMRKQLELEAVHARERAVLDGASFSIIGTDLLGLIHTFNLGAERMLGYRADEVIGKHTPALIHERVEVQRRAQEIGVPADFEVFVHAAWNGHSETREWTYVRKDGTRVPIALTVTPMRDPQGIIIGFMGIAEDISERRRFIVELQKLALVASRTHNLVVVTDANVRAEWVNDAFTRVTGYTLEEVKGRKIGPLVQGPETDQSVVAITRQAIRAGEGFQVELLNYSKFGRKYWLEIDCRPFHAADGSLLGFIAVEAEITSRKEMEAQLRESEARLRAFVEALPDMVFRLSESGVFLDVHAPREDVLLMPKDHFIGRRASDVLPVELSSVLLETIERARMLHAPQTYEYQVEIRGRSRDFEARVVLGLGSDMLVIVRDVSERKLLDLMKDEFVSTVSHELRTPLTAIQGTLGLLAAGVLGGLTAEALELVTAALGNAERLGRLINDILDLEKVTQMGLELRTYPQSLAALIDRAVLETAVFAAEFSVTYSVGELNREAKANVDPDRFLQILNNLLSNAAKYGNSHEVVRIGMDRLEDGWRVFVRNRGVPIPESFRRRIFSRFAVVDGTDMRARQGTGLGLAITKALVERMGGRIDYVSTAEFTEFFVILPAVFA